MLELYLENKIQADKEKISQSTQCNRAKQLYVVDLLTTLPVKQFLTVEYRNLNIFK